MFCEKCGADMKENRFCPECGAEARKAEAPIETTTAKGNSLPENTAALLCYVLGWITGVVFLVIDKRDFVRFHAMQSIVTFGALSLISIVLNRLFILLPYTLWRLWSGVNGLIGLGGILLAIFLIIQAYKGKFYKLPFAGDLAERLAGKKELKI